MDISVTLTAAFVPGSGGGIANDGGTLTVTNSTIAYNSVSSGGDDGGGLYSNGADILDNTIVAALNTTRQRHHAHRPATSQAWCPRPARTT